MINESYVEKLLKLIKKGLLSVEDIKDSEYKAEVESKLNLQ